MGIIIIIRSVPMNSAKSHDTVLKQSFPHVGSQPQIQKFRLATPLKCALSRVATPSHIERTQHPCIHSHPLINVPLMRRFYSLRTCLFSLCCHLFVRSRISTHILQIHRIGTEYRKFPLLSEHCSAFGWYMCFRAVRYFNHKKA